MNKLTALVKVIYNDKDCVILSTKRKDKMALICTGCFNGDENTIRLTKEKEPTYTIFNGSSHYSMSENMLVSQQDRNKMRLIKETVVEDFGIALYGNDVAKTCGDASVEKARSGKHVIRLCWFHENDIAIHRDSTYIKHVKGKENARKWVFEHFDNVVSETPVMKTENNSYKIDFATK